jgi:hypothetical protein
MQAFLDESGSDQVRDPHTYLLAAAICSDEEVETARSAIRALRLGGQQKVHWRDESAGRRRKIASAVASLPLDHLVVIHDAQASDKPERRRRRCLTAMLFELDQRGIDTATFESRGAADDKKDLAHLANQRTSRAVSSNLRIEHRPGPAEPMLWIPDALCGSVLNSRCGEGKYLEIIQTSATVEILSI